MIKKYDKKNKKGDKKNLLNNFIFLKIVVSNIHNALGANHFIHQFNISAIC